MSGTTAAPAATATTAPTAPPAVATPLQLGERVYPVAGPVVLAPFNVGAAPELRRVTVSAQDTEIDLAFGDSVTLDRSGDYVELKAVDDPATGCQVLYGLRAEGDTVALDRVSEASGGALQASTFSVDASAQRIVGILPADPGATPAHGQTVEPGPLLLAGSSADQLVLTAIDPVTGVARGKWSWPFAGVTVAGARLLRVQRDAHVVLVLSDVHGAISVINIPAGALSARTPPRLSPLALATSVPGAAVTAVVAQLDPASGDQMLVVAVPQAAAANLYVVSIGADGPQQLGTPQSLVDASAMPPARPEFRLAAADLDDDGADEVVVGWTTDEGAAGSVALSLLGLDPKSRNLTHLSKYTAAGTDGPVASVDLWLEAGMFGTDLANLTQGVLVVSCGAGLSDLEHGRSKLFAQVVAVKSVAVENADGTWATQSSFPPSNSQEFVTLGAAVAPPLTALATAADLGGLSVTLGPPTFQQVTNALEIMAIIAIPPFERALAEKATKPQLTFTRDENSMSGCMVSSNKTWMTSNDVAATLGVGPLVVSRHMNKTYGTNFDRNTDATTMMSLSVMATITDQDLIIVNGMDYWVWRYPVRRPAAGADSGGSLLVVFPATDTPHTYYIWGDSSDYGYAPPHEIGSLLSYVQVLQNGLGADELFALQTASAGTGADATLNYIGLKTTGGTTTEGHTVHNTVTDSAHLAGSVDLFDFLPASFGLNVTSTDSYSDNEMTTTTISYSDSMSLSISAGDIPDSGYEYNLTPHVYSHEQFGWLMVNYDVELTGMSWKTDKRYSWAYPKLICPQRTSTADKVLAAYSRSIGFAVDASNQVTIEVSVLNCGRGNGSGWVCTAYTGYPTFDHQTQTLQVPADEIGTVTMGEIGPCDRQTAQIPWPGASPDTVVCVQIAGTGLPEIGWNVYPPGAFVDLKAP